MRHGHEPLLDIPTLRPYDTWFGPNTREGELCYASRMVAYIRMQEAAPRPHPAITPVHICNRAAGPLAVARLSVPVPLLSLHANAQGHFWTQSVILERRAHTDSATLQLGSTHLPEAAPMSVSEVRAEWRRT